MQQPSKLQIADLETVESVVEQEITDEEAAKIIGGGIAEKIVGGRINVGLCPYFPEPDPPYPQINGSIERKIEHLGNSKTILPK